MTPDQVSLWHNYNIDLTTKSMTISGDVDDEMAINALKNLHILNQTSGLITIYLSTGGGNISSARIMYDVIKSSANRVRIICAGEVMSAGTIILMSGDDRIMLPNSVLMKHLGSQSITDQHPINLEKWTAQMKLDVTFMNNTYLERINEKRRKDKKRLLLESDIHDSIVFDTFYTPKEALALGLITEIGYTI